jgi:hypothetical protein
MTKKERLNMILKSSKTIDRKLVHESLALLRQMKKLGVGNPDHKTPNPPYSPTIRAMQPGDSD